MISDDKQKQEKRPVAGLMQKQGILNVNKFRSFLKLNAILMMTMFGLLFSTALANLEITSVTFVPSNVSQAGGTQTFTVTVTIENEDVVANNFGSFKILLDDSTFNSLFSNERWDEGSAPEMEYTIPVPNGNYIVNLFLGNGYHGTTTPGTRVYDVFVEDVLVQDNLDLITTFGNETGGMLAFPVSINDGIINIAFGHEVENPLI